VTFVVSTSSGPGLSGERTLLRTSVPDARGVGPGGREEAAVEVPCRTPTECRPHGRPDIVVVHRLTSPAARVHDQVSAREGVPGHRTVSPIATSSYDSWRAPGSAKDYRVGLAACTTSRASMVETRVTTSR